MHLNASPENETSTLAVTLSSVTTTAAVTKIPPTAAGVRPHYPFPPPRPTVSLDARPIVIPILSCVFTFPVLTFAVICALRYRAQRLRRKDHLKRLQGGYWWRSDLGWNNKAQADSTKVRRPPRDENFLESSWSDRGTQWGPGQEAFSLDWHPGSEESLANTPEPPPGAILGAISIANRSVMFHFEDAVRTVNP